MSKQLLILPVLLTSVTMAIAADATADRVERSVEVLNKLTQGAKRGIPPDKLQQADCIAVIPGFKKGAAVVGIGYGRGFISCRQSSGWSAPGAVSLSGGSLGVQLGAESLDIVILSLDKDRRSKLLSERFAIGSDASAAWGNGASARSDQNAKLLFYGKTKGAFAGFGLDGVTIKADEAENKILYGKPVKNEDVVNGNTEAPVSTQTLVAKLADLSSGSSTTAAAQ